MSLVLDEHREYLADVNRIEAFRRALALTVRPGDVVLDLASGTGILGLLACRAGASRVYALEQSGLAGIARDIASANGFADRITVIREHSTRAELPEAVDCMVCDQVGHFGFEAGVFELTADASRWLKPGGRFVPCAVELWLAPVEHLEMRARRAFWETRPAGFEFAAAAGIARNTGYPMTLTPEHLLADEQRLVAVTLPHDGVEWLTGEVEFDITRNGLMDGIGGWFRAELAPGVMLTNAPGHSRRINRRNVVLPAASPIAVSVGDRLRVRVRVRPIDSIVSWEISMATAQQPAATVVTRASTFGGLLLSSEDLTRSLPISRPRLTRAGEARRTLLGLIDGQHTVQQIEDELMQAFPDLLRSRERTAEFVAEVLAGYAH